jgi:hypothetical protein
MKNIITILTKAIDNNSAMCMRIATGVIRESDAVYMQELGGPLTDRELYIHHMAFNAGVRASLETIRDYELPEEDLLGELFNTPSSMGKKGGSSKSSAKSTASRENGKKGGRPRKVAQSEKEENK